MLGVYRREMRAYLVSPIAYILLFTFTGFMAWWFFHRDDQFFVFRRATMNPFFGILPWVFIIILPALSMRLWSEEIRGGTIETLLTLPVATWKLVVGKFLSAWTLLLLCLVATLPIPITVAALGATDGALDWGPVVAGYAGALLMGGALLALGIALSAITGHQIVAFLLTAVAAFVLVLIDPRFTGASGGLESVFEYLSVSARYEAMGRGVIDLRDVLYFVSFTAFFLYLSTIMISTRRFR